MLALPRLARPTLLLLASWLLAACAGSRARATPPPALSEERPRTPPVTPGGVGSLEVRGARGDASLARLTRVHVVARQRGDMAEVEASHTFYNDSDAVLEGTFRFPLPDGALLTGLAMMLDGKLMESELVEREKARKTYETIVDGMQDPALLEWEHGSVFKMRVFPLEPRKDKLVVVRYLMPLERDGDGLRFVQSAQSASGSGPLSELVVDWEGRRVFQGRDVDPALVLVATAQPASAVLQESRADGSYAVLRLRPDFRRAVAPQPPSQVWFIVVDTSRSALEELPRELEALEAVLRSLPTGGRFQVVTSDLEARPSARGLEAVTEASIAGALSFVREVTPDGASDLGRAFTVVGELARSVPGSAVVYLGDCEPTWGLTEPRALVDELRRRLPQSPVYPMLFGSSVNDELASELAEASGGRRARIRRREELDAFTRTLAHPLPLLGGVALSAPEGTTVLTMGPRTLEPGRELLVFVKAPPGRDPLSGLSARVTVAGAPLDLIPRVSPERATGVAQRFGAAWVRDLERRREPAPSIVAASLHYGVMSKLTSFLVLESEEAYARFAIERRRAESSDSPRVTGANLESADGASISADRVQPGDPEIFIDAPSDALRITVDLPNGETKLAAYDPDARGGRGAWMVRFLVPLGTPEGDYEALARITHPSGELELRRVRYTVDGTAPELDVRLSPAARRPGWVEVLVSELGNARSSDLKRVEVRTPAGTVHSLEAIRWGVFRVFVPQSELRGGVLRVVGFDLALNHTVKEVSLP
jgi:Vault protein inter-alpha-trypsin domain/von Willebrand factor type A domain